MNPSDVEAAVCATILERPDLLDTITLTYKDFENKTLQLVYRTIEWIVSKGAVPNYAIVLEKLSKRADVDIDLLTESVNALHAQTWAIAQNVQIIKQRAVRRKMRLLASKLLELSESDFEMDQMISEFEDSWGEILESADDSQTGLQPIGDLLVEHQQLMNERINAYQNRRHPGISTGSKMIDAYTSGFKPSNFYVIAARPSIGKTAISLHMAVSSAQADYAAVFSIEMDKMSLIDRIVSAQSHIEMNGVIQGSFNSEDYTKYSNGVALLENKNLYIDDNGSVNVRYLRSRIRRIKRVIPEGRKLVVFVDYLQIMRASKGRSRNEEVANISKDLKQLAKDCNCAVVALSQLNRNVEHSQDKRPSLSDIRESGQIEQDADVVMLLYRDDYYNKDSEDANTIEVIVAKNRNGKTGTAKLAFLRQFQLIEDMSGRVE